MHVEAEAVARAPGRFGAALALALALALPCPAWAAGEVAPRAVSPAGPPPQAVAPASVEAPAARPRVADPAPNPLAAWSGAGDLATRADRARIAALEVGVPSFDAPARALLLDPEAAPGRLERAQAAATVAPELPLAQAALADALLRESHDLRGAAAAAWRSVAALARHREARLWVEANGFLALRNALFFGALAFLAGLAALHARAAAHDLGDRIARALPGFARAGLLGMLLLLPAILGQGLLGLALSFFTLALCYGSRSDRRAAWTAAILLLVGLALGSRAAAQVVTAFDPDPVSSALQQVEGGLASRGERVRLESASTSDPLAVRALALQARREGRLAEAAQRYEALLESEQTDASLANNAANVWLALGNVDRSVALYELAAQLGASPIVLYNLAYGYGQAIRPSAQDETLQRLQRLDPALAFDLTQLQAKIAGGFTLDLPMPLGAFRDRAAASAIDAVTADLRRPLAPGALGANSLLSLAAFLAASIVARTAFRHFRPSGGCGRCGVRLCPRCDGLAAVRDLCGACHRLFERPETADPERRARRLAELERRLRWLSRARLAASFALPGAAGLLARRPWLGLAGALAFCSAVAFAFFSSAGVVDPLAAGGAGTLAAAAATALAAGLDLALCALALQRRSGARG